jgi:hypothetical protein
VREQRERQKVEINATKAIAPLNGKDLPLMFITHNDMALRRAIPKHDRKVGVTHFYY